VARLRSSLVFWAWLGQTTKYRDNSSLALVEVLANPGRFYKNHPHPHPRVSEPERAGHSQGLFALDSNTKARARFLSDSSPGLRSSALLAHRKNACSWCLNPPVSRSALVM